MKTIVLPDLTIEIECDLNITMMVLGGRKPSADWMRSLDFYKNLWAVDSGIDPCFEAGILPDKLVGDGEAPLPKPGSGPWITCGRFKIQQGQGSYRLSDRP